MTNGCTTTPSMQLFNYVYSNRNTSARTALSLICPKFYFTTHRVFTYMYIHCSSPMQPLTTDSCESNYKVVFFHYSYFLWNWHCDTDDGQWMKPINCTILFFVYCSLPLRMPRDILLLLFSSTMTWLGSILHLVTQLQFQHYWLVVSAHSHSSLIISVSENGQILLLIPQLVKSPRLVPTFIITLIWHHHSIMHRPLCGYLYVTTPICILSQMYIHSAFDVANDGALPRGHPGY